MLISIFYEKSLLFIIWKDDEFEDDPDVVNNMENFAQNQVWPKYGS